MDSLGRISFQVFKWNEEESCWRVFTEISTTNHDTAINLLKSNNFEGEFIVLPTDVITIVEIKTETTATLREFGEWTVER